MSVPTAEQSGYLSTLEDVASMIQKAQTNIRKCPKQRLTEGYVKTRIKTIDDYWNTFKHAHNNLTKCTPREQRGILPYFLNEEFYKFEEIYLCLQADLADHLVKLQPHHQQKTTEDVSMSVPSSNGQLSFAALPRIQLPIYSGKYEDWPTYQDLFTALVHNTSLSNVQKLHYLKTSVSGEADMLLRHIKITESNYILAWELLKERFGNKKMIVTSLLKRLFSQKKVFNQSASQIKSLLDTTTECINSLNNLNICTDSWDPVIVFLVTQKLDTESFKDWEEQVQREKSDEMSTWVELQKFLSSKFRTLELITTTPTVKSQNQKSFHLTTDHSKEDIFQSAHASIINSRTCTYCNGEHYIFNCKEFVKQTVEKRQEFVRNKGLCYNCLTPNHNVYRCKQRTTCRVCRRRHHSLLHRTRETINQEKDGQIQPEQTITSAHFSQKQPGREVLLATARVEVKSINGNTYTLRALIDQGSEASFVSARIVELLGLSRTNINGVVSGVGEGTQILVNHLVDLTITSRLNSSVAIPVKAYVLKSISTRLPSKHVVMNWPELQTLKLADPNYNTPGKIDMLLGADVFCKIIEDGLMKMPDGIVAQKTMLGWILSGQKEDTPVSNEHNLITLHITRMATDDNDLLRRFWEIDTDLYKKRKLLTREEERCEEIYKDSTTRDEMGRYIVHLPLKQSIEDTVNLCGETKQQAITRFKQLEKRFQRDENLKIEYSKVMHEYMEMGHMKKSETLDDYNSIYLAHHAIVRNEKETSKVRVVFDASAKGSNGHSLNETMMIGPILQPDLRSLIITWRTHKICVVGDIVKMYRMIKMTEEHTNLQRIVWRDNPNEDLKTYNLTTVTFGTAAAPFLAVRTLNQVADDEGVEYPNTASLIKKSFYMDDLMVGSEDVEKTKKLCKEIGAILKKGKFEMQKWSSNSEEVLQYLQENNTEDRRDIKLDKIIRILGLTWDRKDDKFEIMVNLTAMQYPITKRSILSDIARLFDPFGWLSPVIITAKLLMQRLWLCNLEWDEILPVDLREEWLKYRKEIMNLQGIKVSRWLKTTTKNYKYVQIHGFADASTQAYAAVTYLRVIEDDIVYVTMIAARTKVAPLKQMSIPKLELCAAALLADLINDVVELLSIPRDMIFAWTDSMVVLSWLQSHSSRWRTFVANRVADITRIVDHDRWRHVQSADNPADIATRGIKACDLANHKIWWSGPEWLNHKKLPTNDHEIPHTELELKTSLYTTVEEEPIWERFSSISRMKRVLAYCRRIMKRMESEKREQYLTLNELQKILEECIKYYQNLVYSKEIEDLQREKQVKKKSSLITLSPFLDRNGILRVGGRLQNADIAEMIKHPVIIPRGQHITKLLINEAHIKTLHGGIQLMMAYLRSHYWVIGLKSAVRKCIHNCKTCVIDKAKGIKQFMGQLPAERVNQHRAFQNSGVDYAGPVLIRTSKGRGHHAAKGYICLFVCMATRAIHLEAVTDLTSQGFIAAFRRFVARRGYCQHLWSDNGTNFVGASKELKELFRQGKDNVAREVAELLANDGTTWHFIPPKMPTYGGLWEAGVQSAKRHLTRINKGTKLTYEEMATLLTQVEACLNSRPICQIDTISGTPLTPGHFLIGEPLISVPDPNYSGTKISLLTRWQFIQQLTQDFWHRWQSEYLDTLQQRHKWQIPVSSPEVGDVVIVKDEDMPPTKWLLGRIKHLHPGTDKLVRVVTVQCKGGNELKRPLYKIIPLPKETNI